MKHFKLLTFMLLVSLFISMASAQDKQQDSGASASLTINSDAFFGLTPIANIGIPLTKDITFTGYAIFWSGIGNNSLFGHWTEFGGGANFSLLGGALNINPQIGILNGNLLSRGGGTNPSFNEGVVPNITFLFEKSKFELEFYYGYYVGTKTNLKAKTTPTGVTTFDLVDPNIAFLSLVPEFSEALKGLGLDPSYFPNRNARNNYTHVWLFPGFQFTDWFSAGIHFEELKARPSGGAADRDFVFYKWQGIYLKFKAGKGTLRVAFGDSSATTLGPSSLQLAKILTDEQAALEYANTPEASNPMDGTYYRVTYTASF